MEGALGSASSAPPLLKLCVRVSRVSEWCAHTATRASSCVFRFSMACASAQGHVCYGVRVRVRVRVHGCACALVCACACVLRMGCVRAQGQDGQGVGPQQRLLPVHPPQRPP
eukprot:2927410-Rhodomonas_salina.1